MYIFIESRYGYTNNGIKYIDKSFPGKYNTNSMIYYQGRDIYQRIVLKHAVYCNIILL